MTNDPANLSSTTHTDVLIVGGGMAGGLLALLLADQGFAVRVLDAGPAPVRPSGESAPRVSTLSEASHWLLRHAGVWDRLDPERVQGEQERYGRRTPEGARQGAQGEEQEDGGRCVVPHPHQVVGPRVHAEQLDVQHVRPPGRGVPVVRAVGRPRPGEATPRESSLDVAVLDVEVVVVGDEALLERGAKGALVKGGHIPGKQVVDVLHTETGEWIFESGRIDTRSAHGTGCTLASACAAL